MATEFPAFIKLEHRPNPAAESRFAAEVDATLGGARRKFEQFTADAQRQLGAALSVPRNDLGSLDLGAANARAAAQAQQARAIAAREVATATALAAREEQDYSQNARLAAAATEALAREEEEAARAAVAHADALDQVQAVLNRTKSQTDAVIAADLRGTNARQNVINSTRASRVAFVQLGQQMTDVTVQAQLGTSAWQIFAQQVPQAAFALSGLEGSANKVEARIGSVATFLSGPWGAAIFAATAVLGPFVYGLFQSGEAADESARSNRTLTEVLNDTTSSYEEVTKALNEYNRAKEKEREVSILALADQAKAIAGNLREADSIRQRLQAMLEVQYATLGGATGAEGAGAAAAGVRNTQSQLERNQAEMDNLRETARNTGIEIADLIAKMNSDPEVKLKTGFEVLREEARKTITDVDALTARLTALNRQEATALDALRKTGGASASAEASLGDMTALIKQLFPGATITATTGGKHVKGSDHYAGRAIDFVPGGGMGQFTTAEVEQMLRDAGVDIRRNASGVEQFFGPGRPASRAGDHDDHFHVAWQGSPPDPQKVAEATRRAEEILAQFGQRAGESIARINERFDEQPRLIDQAAQATRQLDATIEELRDKQPPGFEKMIEDAQAAKDVIQDALVRPFEELAEAAERRAQIDGLVLAGREKEAAVLEEIWRMEERLGPLTADQRAEIEGIVLAEQDRLELNKKIADQQSAYLGATREVRSEIEAILSGRGDLGNFKDIFRNLQGKILTEQIFGPALDELDKFVKGQTSPLSRSVDILATENDRAAQSVAYLANAAVAAGDRLLNPDSVEAQFDAAFPGRAATGAPSAANDNGILVLGKRIEGGVAGMTPERYFEQMTNRVAGPLLDKLDETFGTKFFSQLQGTLSGAMYGFATGGEAGGILGALRGLVEDKGGGLFGGGDAGNEMAGAVYDGLTRALGGTQTGTMVHGLADMVGIDLSKSGSQIGGAIGSFIPIPGGDIIGAIAGGIIGKLIGGADRGSAIISGGKVSGYYGDTSKYKDASGDLAGTVLQSIDRIAEQFGATMNSALGKVSIGIRDGEYYVDPQGRGYTKKSKYPDIKGFGEDAQAAVRAAILDLINDGVIAGLRQGTLNLIKAGDDLDAQLQKAMDYEDVFKRLNAYKNPLGAAFDDLEKEFDYLRDVFAEAGASTEELAQLEELYAIERREIIERESERLTSSLKGLLHDLTVGNDNLSLREREQLARAAYDPLAARVRAGDSTAYDAFADAARELLDIERQIYGSQEPYFALLGEVTNLTKAALAAQEAAVAQLASNPADPLSGSTQAANDNQGVIDAVNGLSTTISGAVVGELRAVNVNLGKVANLLAVRNGTTGVYQFGADQSGF